MRRWDAQRSPSRDAGVWNRRASDLIAMRIACPVHPVGEIGSPCFLPVRMLSHEPETCGLRERNAFAKMPVCEACGETKTYPARGRPWGGGDLVLDARMCGRSQAPVHAHVLCDRCLQTEDLTRGQATAWCLALPEERTWFRLDPAFVEPDDGTFA